MRPLRFETLTCEPVVCEQGRIRLAHALSVRLGHTRLHQVAHTHGRDPFLDLPDRIRSPWRSVLVPTGLHQLWQTPSRLKYGAERQSIVLVDNLPGSAQSPIHHLALPGLDVSARNLDQREYAAGYRLGHTLLVSSSWSQASPDDENQKNKPKQASSLD